MYKNTHAIIRDRPTIRKRLDEHKEKLNGKRALSVLMLSIDSVSRLNLIRAMPKTAQHLYDSGWFELQGYNKVICIMRNATLFDMLSSQTELDLFRFSLCLFACRLMTIHFQI